MYVANAIKPSGKIRNNMILLIIAITISFLLKRMLWLNSQYVDLATLVIRYNVHIMREKPSRKLVGTISTINRLIGSYWKSFIKFHIWKLKGIIVDKKLYKKIKNAEKLGYKYGSE